MTCLTISRRSRYTGWTLLFIVLGGCAGAHAAKAHGRTTRPAHNSQRSYPAPHRTPAAPTEIKPLVGELMA
ncbi:MAG TPA: hypothetical protein VGO33_06875 [Gemmatimonadaceae bacterium]|nr:hypothetical protein [Gemmatimonadaceae bacterium]